jgi:hypothetical protein
MPRNCSVEAGTLATVAEVDMSAMEQNQETLPDEMLKIQRFRPLMTSRNFEHFVDPIPHRHAFITKALVLLSQNP